MAGFESSLTTEESRGESKTSLRIRKRIPPGHELPPIGLGQEGSMVGAHMWGTLHSYQGGRIVDAARSPILLTHLLH